MNLSHPLLQGSRKQLVEQLVYFDEELSHFLDQYAAEYNQRRIQIERVIHDYVRELERILSHLSSEMLSSTALIGSQLEVRYLDDLSIEVFTIVFPEQADPNLNKLSFLSPFGMQLLMAKPGETYQLDVPSGQLTVRVETVTFVNGGHVNESVING